MKNCKIIIYILLIVGLIFIALYLCDQRQNDEFKLITDETEMTEFVTTHTQEELDEYYVKVDELKAQDTFGGETPEETLEMYIEALKVGDVELASKYFRLEDQDGELNRLSSSVYDVVKESIDVFGVAENIECNDSFNRCEVRGVYRDVDIIIAKFVKIDQSGLWKLRSI